MSNQRPLGETEIHDVCIVIRLQADAFGLPMYSTVDQFVKANQRAVEEILRHVDGVDVAQVSSDINGSLPVLEKWNWDEWHKKGEA